jgi:hypothetical protein
MDSLGDAAMAKTHQHTAPWETPSYQAQQGVHLQQQYYYYYDDGSGYYAAQPAEYYPNTSQEPPADIREPHELQDDASSDSYSRQLVRGSKWRWVLFHVTIWLTLVMLGAHILNFETHNPFHHFLSLSSLLPFSPA